MIRRGQTTTLQERLEISERAAAGQSDPAIAAALGCSVWTVRNWRRRGQHQGRTGLRSRMGHPTNGPLSTLATGMREASCTCAGRIPVGGRIHGSAELRVDLRWADPPAKSLPHRGTLRSRVNCPPHRSSRKAPRMTSGNSMRHQPHARGGSGESQSDHHS